MRIILTGFGPFKGVEKNPTTELVEGFDGDVAEKVVLETSAVGSLQQLSRVFIDQLGRGGDEDVFFLHLGVHGSAREVHVERYAYNQADFRVTDERQFAPRDQAIFPGMAVGKAMETSVDVGRLVGRLRARGHKVRESDDPGRFVCNFVLANSQELCSRAAQAEGGRRRWMALFVHVPPFEVMDEGTQRAIMASLVAELYAA